MARDVVSAKLDIIFKKLFTENEDMLHSFVASMLDVPQESISKIKITNPELPPETLAGQVQLSDVTIRITDYYRTIEEQNELYAQGRTKPGKIVTWVSNGYSIYR